MSEMAAIKAIGTLCSIYGQAKTRESKFEELAVQGIKSFPDNILADLIDPEIGIIATSKYMPSIAEMREYCITRQDALRGRKEPRYYKEPEPEIMPPHVRERMLKRFAELQTIMTARAGRDLFQQYASTKRQPGDIIDVKSSEFIQFCEARNG